MALCPSCVRLGKASCVDGCQFTDLFTTSAEDSKRFHKLHWRYDILYLHTQLQSLTSLEDKERFISSLEFETTKSIANPLAGVESVVDELRNELEALEKERPDPAQLQALKTALQGKVDQQKAKIVTLKEAANLATKKYRDLLQESLAVREELRTKVNE